MDICDPRTNSILGDEWNELRADIRRTTVRNIAILSAIIVVCKAIEIALILRLEDFY